MSEVTFRRLLAELLRAAAEGGLDPFFLHNEISVAGMQIIDECRVDLVCYDAAENDDNPLE